MAPPDTALPLPLYPFPLCPHSTSCQLGSFPLLLAVPVTQDRSCRRRGFCPLSEAAHGRQEQGRKGKENTFCISYMSM